MSMREITTAGDSAAAEPDGHLDPTKPYPLAGVTVVDFSRLLAGP